MPLSIFRRARPRTKHSKLLVLLSGIALLTAISCAQLTGSEAYDAKGIIWQSQIETALKKAKTEDKPLLLDFYNPG